MEIFRRKSGARLGLQLFDHPVYRVNRIAYLGVGCNNG